MRGSVHATEAAWRGILHPSNKCARLGGSLLQLSLSHVAPVARPGLLHGRLLCVLLRPPRQGPCVPSPRAAM